MFKLNSDSQFSDRSQSVFGSIDDIASKANNKLSKDRKKDTSSEDFNEDERKKTTQDFKGRESIFRSPNESGWPPSSGRGHRRSDNSRRHRQDHHRHRPRPPRKVPDHIVNPDKYTKYDLSDVSKDQMSDRSNTRAAFDFLAEMKDRQIDKSADSSKDDQNADSSKVTFKKPVRQMQKTSTSGSSSNVVKDGVKRVMPECVVGQKRSKDPVRKNSNKKAKSQSQISLSHLDEDEESCD